MATAIGYSDTRRPRTTASFQSERVPSQSQPFIHLANLDQYKMSHIPQNTSISLSTRLLCYLGPPSAVILIAAASPQTALLSPIAALPTALAYKKWTSLKKRDPSHHGELEPMIWTFATATTLGFAAASLFQIAVFKATSFFLFRDRTTASLFFKEFVRNNLDGITESELAFRALYSNSWQNWVWMAVLAFVGAGLGEEVVKILPIVVAQRRGTPGERKKRNRAYIDYVLAGAFGFSVIECLGFLHVVCQEGQSNLPEAIWTLMERIPGQFGHVAVSLLSAIRATRRDYYAERLSWLDILGPAVCLHGIADFTLFGISALAGNIGWIHPSGVWTTVGILTGYVGLVSGIVWKGMNEWRALDDRDLSKEE